MRICAKCRHHRRWYSMFGLVHDDCLSRVKYTTNQITGYREEHDVVGCYARNADGNCPDFEPRGLMGWLKRLLGLNATPAGETMQAEVDDGD